MTGSGQRILVVDDDRSLRLLCRVNLELDGFQVVEASTLERGPDGAARRSASAPSCSTCTSAPENGLELLDELRAHGRPRRSRC